MFYFLECVPSDIHHLWNMAAAVVTAEPDLAASWDQTVWFSCKENTNKSHICAAFDTHEVSEVLTWHCWPFCVVFSDQQDVCWEHWLPLIHRLKCIWKYVLQNSVFLFRLHCVKIKHIVIDSLPSSATIWWQRYLSAMAQIMACWLTPPSHYLNQCWLETNGIQPSAVSQNIHKICWWK